MKKYAPVLRHVDNPTMVNCVDFCKFCCHHQLQMIRPRHRTHLHRHLDHRLLWRELTQGKRVELYLQKIIQKNGKKIFKTSEKFSAEKDSRSIRV